MKISEKYTIVYGKAKEFINRIIEEYPKLNQDILNQHLHHKDKFENIDDANRRLIRSLTNRNMMASVINFRGNEHILKDILFGFNPEKIVFHYGEPESLFIKFKETFTIKNAESKRNLWRKFSEGIISCSKFMSSFKSKEEFNKFIDNFSLNKYTKSALPMLLDKEITGLGFALACNFLKELGYRDYPKPDVWLIKIFYQLGLCESKEPYEVYKSIVDMADIVGEDAYTIDKIFWLIGSGRFYLVNVNVGRNADKFIKEVKELIK